MNVVFTQNSREQRRAAFHYAVKTIFSILVLAGSSLALAIPGTQVQSKYAGADAGDWGGKNGAVIGPADGTCANMGALDKVNLISNFNFDLPNDAIITDISAQIKAGSNGGQDVGVQLATNAAVDPPTTVGNQRNLSTLNVGSGNCAVTDITTIGGSLASWGNPAINPGNINTTQFGLVFSKLVTSEVKVDSVCLEISYTTVTGLLQRRAVSRSRSATPSP